MTRVFINQSKRAIHHSVTCHTAWYFCCHLQAVHPNYLQSIACLVVREVFVQKFSIRISNIRILGTIRSGVNSRVAMEA